MPLPPPPPPNQMIDVEILLHSVIAAGGSGSRLGDFVYHYRRQNPSLTLPTKAQIDTAFQAAVVVPLGAALNVRFLQSRNSIRYLNDATDAYVDFSHAVAGAITGDSMTTVNSAFALGRSGMRGKKFNAKKHYFPLSESDTTTGSDDILNAGAITRFTTANTAWLNGFTDASGNQWLPTVFSRSSSQFQSNPTDIVAVQLTQILLNKRIGTMKHRKVLSDY